MNAKRSCESEGVHIMKYLYEGIFEKADSFIEVYFPDLDNARTFGDNYGDAALMASDLLETYLSYLIQSGLRVPKARFDHELSDGQTAAFFMVSAPVDEPSTMSVAEAADLLGVSARRINALIADGTLTAVKEGRDNMVTIASVDARLAAPQKAGRPRKDTAEQAAVG